MPNEYPLIIRVHSFITYLKLLSNSIKGLRTKRFSAVSIGASLRCTTLFNIVTSVNKRLLIGVQVNQAQVHGQVAAYGFLEPRWHRPHADLLQITAKHGGSMPCRSFLPLVNHYGSMAVPHSWLMWGSIKSLIVNSGTPYMRDNRRVGLFCLE